MYTTASYDLTGKTCWNGTLYHSAVRSKGSFTTEWSKAVANAVELLIDNNGLPWTVIDYDDLVMICEHRTQPKMRPIVVDLAHVKPVITHHDIIWRKPVGEKPYWDLRLAVWRFRLIEEFIVSALKQ